MDNVGAKYPAAYVDADGDFLSGRKNYKLHVPKDVPVALFWSVTVYDPITGSGLDNGQPFPSINTMDKPAQNADGSFDIYFGPKSPGPGKNWLATLPRQRLVRDLPPLRTEAGVFRPDMETGRHCQAQVATVTWIGKGREQHCHPSLWRPVVALWDRAPGAWPDDRFRPDPAILGRMASAARVEGLEKSALSCINSQTSLPSLTTL